MGKSVAHAGIEKTVERRTSTVTVTVTSNPKAGNDTAVKHVLLNRESHPRFYLIQSF